MKEEKKKYPAHMMDHIIDYSCCYKPTVEPKSDLEFEAAIAEAEWHDDIERIERLKKNWRKKKRKKRKKSDEQKLQTA